MRRLVYGILFAGSVLGHASAQAAHGHADRFVLEELVLLGDRDRVCYVINQDHLRVLGGYGRVKRGDRRDRERLLGGPLYPCPLPDGLYRYRHDDQVYLLENGRACRVVSRKQFYRLGGRRNVETIGKELDLLGGRRGAPPCERRGHDERYEERERGWSGFYRRGNHPQVFLVNGDDVCRVTSMDQLQAMGGDSARVETVADQHTAGHWTRSDPCPWPDGFYQVTGRAAVYMVRSGETCTVRDPQQLRALGGYAGIQQIDPGAGLVIGRDPDFCR